MEAISTETEATYLPETYSDQFAEGLSWVGNIFKNIFWESQVKFIAAVGYLDAPVSSTYEIAKRTLILVPATHLGLLGHALTGISNRFRSREFTYLRGEGKLVCPSKTKILHLNACMFPGSLPKHFGDMSPAKGRMDKLINLIHQENPDLFFLCEFNQMLSEDLFAKLKGNYKHFFVNIGSNALGIDASMAVVSRVPIVSQPKFIPTQIAADGDQKLVYRGYFILETKDCKYLYTHLHAQETDRARAIRREQLEEIRKITEEGDKPWVIVGDININRSLPEYNMEGFNDAIAKEHGNVMTCEEKGHQESIDYVLTRDDRLNVTTKIKQDLTLSDHSSVTATISLAEKN